MPNEPILTDEQKMRRISRRSFVWALASVFGVFSGIRFIASRSQDMGVPWPLRRSLDFTDSLSTDLVQKNTPEFKDKKIDNPMRVNSEIGQGEATREDFVFTITGAGADDIKVPMADLLKMPKTTQVTEFHCIEGWTQTVQWTGVRLSEVMEKYPPMMADGTTIKPGHPGFSNYVGMETADGAYYVGLDMESAMHPQTLLCYEMNGEELPDEHGGPLRLVIPVKYGVKNIKWLASMSYGDVRPKDYWAEQGYDWFAGL